MEDDIMSIFRSRQYRYYKEKLRGTMYQVWDLEFQRMTRRTIYEEIRLQHDKIVDELHSKELFLKLVEQFGFEPANKVFKSGIENAEQALRDGEQDAVAKNVGLESLKKLKQHELSKADRDVVTNLHNDIKPVKEDVEQLKKQMDGITQEIEQMDNKEAGLRELRSMLRKYMKNV